MPRRYHEALGVTESALRGYGVFDGFTDLDSQFYVDPRLLDRTRVPEFKHSGERVRDHFGDVARLLRASSVEGDMMWKGAVSRLQFREVTNTGLGFGAVGVQGSGIGVGLASQLAQSASQLIGAGIDDPRIFELVGLFQPGFGPDRLSDAVVRIILPDLLAYGSRVVAKLDLPHREVDMAGGTAVLPFDKVTGRWFILLPERILTPLPVAKSYTEIDAVCRANEELRQYLNAEIGAKWRSVIEAMPKKAVAPFLAAHPDAARQILESYAQEKAAAYDFVNDPRCELRWHAVGVRAVSNNPLSLSLPQTGVPALADVVEVVGKICEQFKHLVENCGVSDVLRDEDGNPRIERVAQRLFLCVAESYCRASNLDISPEANAGSGPVDFKLSRGHSSRVLVELKRSNNSQLKHGYLKQLERYKHAEQTSAGFFLIVDYGGQEDAIQSIVRKSRRDQRAGKPFSTVVCIDATKQPAASRWHRD